MFNPFEASNSVNDWESFIVECYICLFYSVIPIFQNLWGKGSWLTFLTGRLKKSDLYVVVNFLFQLIFIFPLFWGMVMYANEFKTKEKQKLTEVKN